MGQVCPEEQVEVDEGGEEDKGKETGSEKGPQEAVSCEIVDALLLLISKLSNEKTARSSVCVAGLYLERIKPGCSRDSLEGVVHGADKPVAQLKSEEPQFLGFSRCCESLKVAVLSQRSVMTLFAVGGGMARPNIEYQIRTT